MAIESYMQHLVQSYIKSEPILEILALVLSSLGRLS